MFQQINDDRVVFVLTIIADRNAIFVYAVRNKIQPGPIPGMRPPMGGAGHVVPPSTKGTSSMSVIMPIYTIGIVIFFTYTLMKVGCL